jgi:hypothetical protein
MHGLSCQFWQRLHPPDSLCVSEPPTFLEREPVMAPALSMYCTLRRCMILMTFCAFLSGCNAPIRVTPMSTLPPGWEIKAQAGSQCPDLRGRFSSNATIFVDGVPAPPSNVDTKFGYLDALMLGHVPESRSYRRLVPGGPLRRDEQYIEFTSLDPSQLMFTSLNSDGNVFFDADVSEIFDRSRCLDGLYWLEDQLRRFGSESSFYNDRISRRIGLLQDGSLFAYRQKASGAIIPVSGASVEHRYYRWQRLQTERSGPDDETRADIHQ